MAFGHYIRRQREERDMTLTELARRLEISIAYLLFLPAISGFLAMGFTGSSTFTSLSGVVKEMKTAVPLMAASLGLGVVFFGLSFFI